MNTVLLSSGGSSSSNWLPFLIPVALLLLIIYSWQYAIKYFKRSKSLNFGNYAGDGDVGIVDTGIAHDDDNSSDGDSGDSDF